MSGVYTVGKKWSKLTRLMNSMQIKGWETTTRGHFLKGGCQFCPLTPLRGIRPRKRRLARPLGAPSRLQAVTGVMALDQH